MVPVLLPEAGRVDVQELEAAHPLCALPEIELRYHEAARTAVVGLEVTPVVSERQERVVVREVLEREVRGVIGVGVDHHKLRAGQDRDPREKLVDPHALPSVVEPRPARDAVDIGGARHAREPEELLPRPHDLTLDESEAPERPARRIEGGRAAVGEDGPFRRARLARGDPPGEGGVGVCHAYLQESGMPEASLYTAVTTFSCDRGRRHIMERDARGRRTKGHPGWMENASWRCSSISRTSPAESKRRSTRPARSSWCSSDYWRRARSSSGARTRTGTASPTTSARSTSGRSS